jgi:NodT family efflux transporter outer membrane factor (OMF) lipoprotein
VESAEAQAEAQRDQLEATYLTLTSNVVAAAIQEASLRGQIAATRDIIQVETDLRALLQKQFELGDVAWADVRVQDAVLGQAEASLPPLEKQLAFQRDLLTALAGRLPNDEVSERFELTDLTLPQDLPVSLPSRLVEQRPDIRAASAQFHSASAEVGVAIANMLPQVTLSGAYGGTSTAFSQLFSPGNIFWSAAGNFSQTLFQGGTLLHRERGAVAAMDQAAAQYRSTVITAFQNVADSLHALQADADALKASLKAQDAARESLEIAKRQLELGSVGTAYLLNAEQLYQQAVLNTLAARTNRYADTVALFQALGGGWWNRADVASETVATQGTRP